ncbi:unnamed protein product [Blepharisma stoltei]|uniref:Acyltransferase 3 domain-containing protein n=1 Tax=Blepharisma stoltei TaxID=1481888 RepID=A0AAU9JHP4_9CILI|nr:unnamed protein product [Blepharisma stoltei]
MWQVLMLIFSLAFSQSSLKECEMEWAKVLKGAEGILDPNPSDYTKMFRYSGFMINNLGEYDPCTDISIAKYTVIEIVFPFMVITLCGPKVCTEEDYIQILTNSSFFHQLPSALKSQNSQKILTQYPNTPIVFPKEYIDDNFSDYSAGAILMIIFIAIIAFICLSATILEYYEISKPQSIDKLGSEPQERSLAIKYLLCFSMITNLKKLFISRSQERLGKKDTLELLNSVRVLSIGWVILGHTCLLLWTEAVISNGDHFIDILKSSDMIIPASGEVSVDTFFWLAGLLVAYLLIAEINSPKKANWIMIYVHRYLRLTPLYLFVILFYWSLQKHIGNGPLWYRGNSINDPCKKYWWTDILYVNNFVPNWKSSTCLGQAWYLANDMQFFIITPPILWLYHKYHRSFGWVSVILMNILSILSSGLIANHFNLNAVPIAAESGQNGYWYYYVKPYCRIGPYGLGIISGLILYSYRKFQDKQITYDSTAIWVAKKFENIYFRYIAGFIGLALININIFVLYDTFKHPGKGLTYPHWTDSENVAFIAFNKVTFGLGITLVLLPALLGHFNWITWVLSWDIWTPLARMTYCVYLIHYNILDIIYRSQKVATILSEFTWIRDAIFFFVISYIIAIPFVLMIEMPALAIEKLAFSSIRAKPSEDQQNKSIILQPLTKG